jgi:hypothetical protein
VATAWPRRSCRWGRTVCNGVERARRLPQKLSCCHGRSCLGCVFALPRPLSCAPYHPCPALARPQVLEFIRELAAAPASPLLASPQLSDFYIHHHFLQFARLYHAALASPRPAPCEGSGVAARPARRRAPSCGRAAALRACRGHLRVLLELAARAPAGGGARRRFLQLRVLDFCLRELSLEHAVKHQARRRARRRLGGPTLEPLAASKLAQRPARPREAAANGSSSPETPRMRSLCICAAAAF